MVPCASKVEKANGLIGSPHSDAGASPKVPKMNQSVLLHARLSRDRFGSVSLFNFASQWEAPPGLMLRECPSHWLMNSAASVAVMLLQRVLKKHIWHYPVPVRIKKKRLQNQNGRRNIRCEVYASAPVPIRFYLVYLRFANVDAPV